MFSSLRLRFLSAEEHLLSSFVSGQQALLVFDKAWTSLLSDYAGAVKCGRVDDQTISLAHTVSSRIAILADHLLSLDVEGNRVCREFKDHCLHALSQPDDPEVMSPIPPTPSANDLPLSCNNPDICDRARRPLDGHAHHWLLQNLHDPYPSSSDKIYIAEVSHSSVAEVQTWFADARQRIGWTALCQARFAGSRRAASEAAVCAYAGQDMGHALPGDVIVAFASIRANAHKLFAESEMDVAQLGGPAGHLALDMNPCQESLDLESSVDEEDTTPPLPIAGRKRRFHDVVEPFEISLSDIVTAPSTKRPRTASQTLPTAEPNTAFGSSAELSLPYPAVNAVPALATSHSSPSSSAIEATHSRPVSGPAEHFIPSFLAHSPSRKRRLSDAGPSTLSKRPRGLAAGPRKQAVTDPLPTALPSNFWGVLETNEWPHSHLDQPVALHTGDLDPSQLFEAAAFDALVKQGESSLPSEVCPTSQLDVHDAELASATALGFDLTSFMLPGDFCISPAGSQYVSPSSDSNYSSITSSPRSLDSSDYWSLGQPSDFEWSNLQDLIHTLGSSPASSQSSLSDCSKTPFPSSQVVSSQSDCSTHALFGMDPFYTSSDLFPEMGELSTFAIESVL